MATLIRENGKEENVVPRNKKRGFDLGELYSLLHCSMVQMVLLADKRSMWMDEEAKLHSGLQWVNAKATTLLMEAGGMPGDEVIGSVLITERGEVK
jgi:hypothetical protein